MLYYVISFKLDTDIWILHYFMMNTTGVDIAVISQGDTSTGQDQYQDNTEQHPWNPAHSTEQQQRLENCWLVWGGLDGNTLTLTTYSSPPPHQTQNIEQIITN